DAASPLASRAVPPRARIYTLSLRDALPIFERREPASLGEAQGAVQVLRLDLDRRELASVGQAHPAAAREVVADLTDGADRVLEREVAPRAGILLEHPQHDRCRADLEERRVLAH